MHVTRTETRIDPNDRISHALYRRKNANTRSGERAGVQIVVDSEGNHLDADDAISLRLIHPHRDEIKDAVYLRMEWEQGVREFFPHSLPRGCKTMILRHIVKERERDEGTNQ